MGFSQLALECGQGVFGGLCLLADLIAQALGHVELGHKERVTLQPARLFPPIRAKIEEPLVLDEAHQSYPLYFSALSQVRRGSVTAVHQPRPYAWIRLLLASVHGQALLYHVLVNAVLADTHRIF